MNYSLALDIAGGILIVGVLLDIVRRSIIGTERLDYMRDEALILVLLLYLGITGFLVEGARLYLLKPTDMDRSPVGALFASIFQSLEASKVADMNFVLWWDHVVAVAIFIAYLPFSKLFHNIAAPINIILQSGTIGEKLISITEESMEDAEKERREDVGFTMRQLVTLNACTACGICQSVCPTYEVERDLSPKRVIQSVKSYIKGKYGFRARFLGLLKNESLLKGERSHLREALWLCTNCWSCMKNCPVLANIVSVIVEIRSRMVEEGFISRTLQDALTNTYRYGNPWGGLESRRAQWAKGLGVKDLSKPASKGT